MQIIKKTTHIDFLSPVRRKIALVLSGLVTLALMAWGGYAAWFAMTHVRASYARVSGLVINVATVALVLALFVALMPARVLDSGP